MSKNASHLKAVSHSPDRFDILRLGCVILYLLTYLLYMDRNRGDIADGLHIPDFLKDLFLRKHMIRVLRQECQQIKLLICKSLFLAVDPDSSRGLINLYTTYLDNIILRLADADQSLISGHVRLHPGYHLTWRKRLGHVIIGTQSESVDLINIILLGRNYNDRNVFYLSDPSADLKSVYSRKHQIQYHQIKITVDGLIQSRITFILDLYLKSRKLKIILFQICYCLFVFYY